MGPRAGLEWCEKSPTTGIRSPDDAARSDSVFKNVYWKSKRVSKKTTFESTKRKVTKANTHILFQQKF